MHTEWTDLLSAYLDDELDPVARRRLDGHLAGCGACRAVLEDLRRIVATAPTYRGIEPERDLWPEIATSVESRRVVPFPARTTWWTPVRQLMAASIVTAAAGAGGAWLWLSSRGTPAAAPVATAGAPGFSTASMTSATYDTAVAALEETLAANRERLDTATVRIVENSLRIIDQAIAEARAAIQRDSANAYLNGQIAANMRKKLTVLRMATRAISSET